MFLSEEVSRTLQLVVFIRKKRSNACREKSAGAIVMQYSIALHMCIGRLGRKSGQKLQTSLDAVSMNTKHTSGVIIVRATGELLIVLF